MGALRARANGSLRARGTSTRVARDGCLQPPAPGKPDIDGEMRGPRAAYRHFWTPCKFGGTVVSVRSCGSRVVRLYIVGRSVRLPPLPPAWPRKPAGKRARRIRTRLGAARTTRGTVGLGPDELRGIGWAAVPEPDPRDRDGREDTCATRYEKIA